MEKQLKKEGPAWIVDYEIKVLNNPRALIVVIVVSKEVKLAFGIPFQKLLQISLHSRNYFMKHVW